MTDRERETPETDAAEKVLHDHYSDVAALGAVSVVPPPNGWETARTFERQRDEALDLIQKYLEWYPYVSRVEARALLARMGRK